MTPLAPVSTNATPPSKHAFSWDLANPFGPTHKGIRWALCQLLLQLGRVNAASRVECSKAFDDLDGVLYLVERHIEHEERHVYRLLTGVAQCDLLLAQHRAFSERAFDLRQRAFELEMAAEISASGLDQLYLAFSQFVAEKLSHMYAEETSLGPLLNDACSPDTLRALALSVQHDMGPDEQALFQRAAAPASRPTPSSVQR